MEFVEPVKEVLILKILICEKLFQEKPKKISKFKQEMMTKKGL